QRYRFRTLLQFALPSIVMQVFLGTYTVVDGIFVSRYAGTTALGCINMIFPLISLEIGIGVMLATGGSAVVARRMGEGQEKRARQNFSFLAAAAFTVGLLFAVLGIAFMNPIVRVLGASEAQFAMCRTYGILMVAFSPAMFLQVLFQTFFVTAGKPGMGLAVTVAGGTANIVLDYVFVKVLAWGIGGAAIATGIGQSIPAVAGTVYFFVNRRGVLRFTKPVPDWNMLAQSCGNGSSEMVTNLANAVTTFLFNYVFLKFYGEDGVAAITIVLYFQFVYIAVYFGYSAGVAPVIAYKYGAQDRAQLKSIFRYSLIFLMVCAVGTYLLSRLIMVPAIGIFAAPDSRVFAITIEGFPVFALSFLMMGFSIFASSMFTALSNGLVSAVISFGRTLFFLAGAILLLPVVLGAAGVWLAVPVAELLGLIVSAVCLIANRSRYGY
ncbi:MAG: MATE family efflux transporter, partial [Butyricicoccaceae bacterium]